MVGTRTRFNGEAHRPRLPAVVVDRLVLSLVLRPKPLAVVSRHATSRHVTLRTQEHAGARRSTQNSLALATDDVSLFLGVALARHEVAQSLERHAARLGDAALHEDPSEWALPEKVGGLGLALERRRSLASASIQRGLSSSRARTAALSKQVNPWERRVAAWAAASQGPLTTPPHVKPHTAAKPHSTPGVPTVAVSAGKAAATRALKTH